MTKDTNKKKILLVDDDELHLSITSTMLKDDYDVLTAKSGKEAVDYFYQGVFPDLILLDILMPEMDGWETLNRIKSISFLDDIPLIFLTSLEDAAAEKRAYEVGALDYIMKPCKKADILLRVAQALEKSRA